MQGILLLGIESNIEEAQVSPFELRPAVCIPCASLSCQASLDDSEGMHKR
jgi:hypothetical protein